MGFGAGGDSEEHIGICELITGFVDAEDIGCEPCGRKADFIAVAVGYPDAAGLANAYFEFVGGREGESCGSCSVNCSRRGGGDCCAWNLGTISRVFLVMEWRRTDSDRDQVSADDLSRDGGNEGGVCGDFVESCCA